MEYFKKNIIKNIAKDWRKDRIMEGIRLQAITAAFMVVAFVMSCGSSYRTLGNADFAEIISRPNTVLVDVRTADEYMASHISGAINMDVQSEDFMTEAEQNIDKDMTVAVYCRTGVRSRKAAYMLSSAGYKVYNLKTGILCWNGQVER